MTYYVLLINETFHPIPIQPIVVKASVVFAALLFYLGQRIVISLEEW